VTTIIDLFLAMQLMVYIVEYNLQLPAIVEMLMEEFKNLIEFEAINPETIIKLITGNDQLNF
jgi:hypothetical protein